MSQKAIQNFDTVQKFVDQYCQLGKFEKLGTWIEEPCFYVSVVDFKDNAGTINKFGLLLGPFRYEDECREYAYSDTELGGSSKHTELLELCEKHDTRAIWYSYGMVKMKNGYRDGIFNKFYPEIKDYGTEKSYLNRDKAVKLLSGLFRTQKVVYILMKSGLRYTCKDDNFSYVCNPEKLHIEFAIQDKQFDLKYSDIKQIY